MLHLQHNHAVQRPESEIVDSFTQPLTTEEMPPKELVGLKFPLEENAKGERAKGNLNLALPFSAAGAAIRNGSGSSAVVNSEVCNQGLAILSDCYIEFSMSVSLLAHIPPHAARVCS